MHMVCASLCFVVIWYGISLLIVHGQSYGCSHAPEEIVYVDEHRNVILSKYVCITQFAGLSIV